MHVFGQWERAREPRENPRKTPLRRAPASWWVQTHNFLAMRRQYWPHHWATHRRRKNTFQEIQHNRKHHKTTQNTESNWNITEKHNVTKTSSKQKVEQQQGNIIKLCFLKPYCIFIVFSEGFVCLNEVLFEAFCICNFTMISTPRHSLTNINTFSVTVRSHLVMFNLNWWVAQW